MNRKASFAPIVDVRTRVLILGSLPGDASLSAARYYAHPRNRFWHLVGAVMRQPNLPDFDYDARLGCLSDRGIGLWDVVKSGSRKGSLDAALRDVEGNDLAALIASLPDLRAIGFNGGTAARIGRKQLGDSVGPALLDLPSSSPAHAAMSLAEKTTRWLALRPYLGLS
ncbi:hypothetical protein AB433_00880 [Croceicoccus naphthovorans]|uniref:Uracil-DNA glycosylase-like domain-containing protein n=1 Tax=Croceicoccus naphthovorans TaxID=1348774 RepID=A0A0G3XIJ9_9SPHN|nr:hypothetical protein AB433_00880 [Croceicoccus naphthovorans]